MEKLFIFFIRLFTSKTFRAQKRSNIFQKLFEDLKECHGENGQKTGLIAHYDLTYPMGCDVLARHYAFYPFQKKANLEICHCFERFYDQKFKTINIKITRTSSFLKALILSKGHYKIQVSYSKDNIKYDTMVYEKEI